MIQEEFARNAAAVLADEKGVIGLTVGGSWLTAELDEFSDVDLTLITSEKISGDKQAMLDYAGKLGKFLSGFTGEHVGESRVLICLYDDPLLHVDLKFLTIEEFAVRIEDPVVLLDKTGQLARVLHETQAQFPYPDYQWIEDRFWIWVHYALLKTGRGEYLEALDFFGFIRMVVLGPLLHIRNNNLPRGVRKAETMLAADDLARLKATIPSYDKQSLLDSLHASVMLYRTLRDALYSSAVNRQHLTEQRVMEYFDHLKAS
jgi:predicted nucleotidyltransferase